MWPLGHAAVAYLAYALGRRARTGAPPADGAVILVALGSQFPDLVDKPLAWYLPVLPTGRSLAHSLLVLVPLAALAVLAARRYGRPSYGVGFAVGALSHTLVDALPALWGGTVGPGYLLWPVVPVESPAKSPTIAGLLLESLGDPYFLLEFVLAAAALALWRRDGAPGLETIRTAIARVRPTAG